MTCTVTKLLHHGECASFYLVDDVSRSANRIVNKMKQLRCVCILLRKDVAISKCVKKKKE